MEKGKNMEKEYEPVRVYLLGFSERCHGKQTADLISLLENAGMTVGASEWVARGKSSYNPLTYEQRAEEFKKALSWDADWILDVSEGEGANGVLGLLDYEGYEKSDAVLAGYFDVTCILNALSWKTGRSTLLFQASGNINKEMLIDLLIRKNDYLCQPCAQCFYSFESIYERKNGIIWGGDIVSFLKLAGTPWMPEIRGETLFVEACVLDLISLISYLFQLEQIGAIGQDNRLMIGELSWLQDQLGMLREQDSVKIAHILKKYKAPLPENLAFCSKMGYSCTSMGLWIGGRPSCFAEQSESV